MTVSGGVWWRIATSQTHFLRVRTHGSLSDCSPRVSFFCRNRCTKGWLMRGVQRCAPIQCVKTCAMCRNQSMVPIPDSDSEFVPTDSEDDCSASECASAVAVDKPPPEPRRRAQILRKRKCAVEDVEELVHDVSAPTTLRRSSRLPQRKVVPKTLNVDTAKRQRTDCNTFRLFNASSREVEALLYDAEVWVEDYRKHWIPQLHVSDEDYRMFRDWIAALRHRFEKVRAGIRKETRITPLVQRVWDDHVRQMCTSLRRVYRPLCRDMLSG